MSQRPRRFTSSRSMASQKRKPTAAGSGEGIDEDKSNLAMGKNWFFQQSPMAQVYYLKVVVGLLTGVVGILYNVNFIAGNWFIFPLIAMAGVYIFVRQYLDIQKDTIDDLPLIFWHGTISLFIGFIVSSVLLHMIINPPGFNP